LCRRRSQGSGESPVPHRRSAILGPKIWAVADEAAAILPPGAATAKVRPNVALAAWSRALTGEGRHQRTSKTLSLYAFSRDGRVAARRVAAKGEMLSPRFGLLAIRFREMVNRNGQHLASLVSCPLNAQFRIFGRHYALHQRSLGLSLVPCAHPSGPFVQQ